MTFQNPAGLWLLLGVPLLVLIYLIRSQHEDKKVSSTFIWKLSERFSKRKIPLQIFRRILLLLLQILAVVLVAFLASRPMITHRANTDYILVIDASASMQSVDKNGVSFFDNAKKKAGKLSEKITGGHKITIISASNEPGCPVRRSENVSEVQIALDSMTCTYGDCDLEKAFTLANTVAAECPNPRVIVYTDRACAFTGSQRVTVENLCDASVNDLALTSLKAGHNGQDLLFTGELLSKYQSGTALIGLKIDGETVDALEVDYTAGEKTEFSFAEEMRVFDTAEVFLSSKDALSLDDSYIYCRRQVRDRSVLIVSASPLYLETSIGAVNGCKVETASSLEEITYGHDLYIFDGISPEIPPEDGSLLYVNCTQWPLGVATGEEFEGETPITRAENVSLDLCKDWNVTSTVTVAYKELICSASFEEILYCASSPVMAAKDQPNGRTVAVLSFDLHDSNLPLQSKFLAFIADLIEFSAPSMIEKTDFSFGENVAISVFPYAEEMYVQECDGKIRALPFENDVIVYQPQQPGAYTVLASYGGEDGAYADFYVHIPKSEYEFGELQELPLFTFEEQTEIKKDATLEISLWLAVAMLILMLAEWGLYYYEQF